MVQQQSHLPLLLRWYSPPRDLAGHRIGQLSEAHIVRQLEQRQFQPVSCLRQLCRQGLGQIASRFDAHAGQPFFHRRGQQRVHGLRIVRDSKARGDEQFSLRQPACVVRRIRQIDAADLSVKTRRAAADNAARECGQAQHLPQRGIVRCVLCCHGFCLLCDIITISVKMFIKLCRWNRPSVAL